MQSPGSPRRNEPTTAVQPESVECRSGTIEAETTTSIDSTVISPPKQIFVRSLESSSSLGQLPRATSEDELMELHIPPTSNNTATALESADNIFMATDDDDGHLRIRLPHRESPISSALESPTDIISEEAIRQAMEVEDDQNDTGMGPGRIRKYATQDPDSDDWRSHDKHFFILSSAGKPIYSHKGDEDKLSTFMGVIQAIISVYIDLDDSIRCLNAGDYRIVFLVRGPVYFLVVTNTDEPESALRDQLLWLYNQIISIITLSQLQKIFDKHRNFDLRRLLGGTESFLDHLCESVGCRPSYILGAIHSMRMDSSVRAAVGAALQNAKGYSKDGLLYGMLIVRESLVTILRPKKHSFHPSDLHLILNMVNSSSSFRSVPESWMPICLPKFNDKGFLHAYVSYITPNYPAPANDLCLVLVSNDRDNFFKMSECKKHLTTSGALFLLQDSIRNSTFKVDELNIPGLRHFLFKSKSNIQFTMPEVGDPYRPEEEQKRFTVLFTMYQRVRSMIHQKNRPLKIVHYVTKKESLFGWTTSSFELYANFSPLVTKPNATHAVNALLRWIKKEEEYLFVTKAPTF